MSDPQPQQPESGRQAEAALIALYLWAESTLLGGMASAARGFLTGGMSPDTVRARIHRMVLEVVNRLSRETPALTGAMVRGSAIEAVGPPRGGRGGSGGSHGGFLPPEMNPGFDPYQLHGIRAANAIRDDIDSELADVRYRLTRLDDDLYKVIAPAGGAGQVLPLGYTPQQAQAKAWREFMRRGVTGFTDKSGRDWALSSYVEMAVRTASQRAYNASRLQVIQHLGGNLVFVSDDGHPCPQCQPWQNKVLCIVPDMQHPSVADATAAGLFHPNAILGDQPVRLLGEAENGVKGWYEGPSVHLTTARGHELTVSPEHPVLTADGWLPAKLLRKGMQVFSARAGHGPSDVPIADVDLDNPQATFEDVLDSLAAVGGRTFVPASTDDLHGDGRFIKGEIEVVVADRRLLPVVESRLVEQPGELTLPGADVQATGGPGASPSLLGGLGVGGAVAGTLPHFHVESVEAASQRRAADAETVGEILTGLAAGVEADELVHVESDWFSGHAYDLQTGTGAYVVSSILVHNCRHHIAQYVPEHTNLPDPREWTDADQVAYNATQKQRALERGIRIAKRELEYARTAEGRQQARKDIRSAQAKMRQFLAEHDDLLRQSRREQLDLSMPTQNVLQYDRAMR